MFSIPRARSSPWDCLSPEVFHEKGVAMIMWAMGMLTADVWHDRKPTILPIEPPALPILRLNWSWLLH